MTRGEPWAATLATLLTITTGATDALSFLRLGGVFASVITGNLVLLGVSVGTGEGELALHAGISLLGYLVGSGVGARICESEGSASEQSRLRASCLGLELAIWLVVLVVFELSSGRPSGDVQLELVACCGLTMGLQSTVARSLPYVKSPTTYMTGVLTEIVTSIVKGQALAQHRQVLLALLGVAVGAGLGALVLVVAPLLAPLVAVVPLALSLLLSTIVGPDEAANTT